MASDLKLMKVALTLARKGSGNVEPNPMVGAVIVKNGKIIGKGYHKKFGGAHAEIEALKNCKISPKDATLYVTLEPCCHFGKTPPCTDAIIKAGIKKVVAAVKDPTRKVSGKGFKILQKAGIEVVCGVCQKEAEKLNAPFFKFAKTKRPWVIVKWAQSKDGFLARTDKKRWITGALSRRDVHKIRKRVKAILVGINTVLEDNPMLTVRPDTGRQPLRVVLDSNLQIPQNCNLIRTAKKVPVCVFTTSSKKIKAKNVETIKIKNNINLKTVLNELGKKGVQQLLVEGGEKVITSFIRQNLADEIIVYTSNEQLAEKGKVKSSQPMKKIYNQLKKNFDDKNFFGSDTRLRRIINAENRNPGTGDNS
ncbi:MAG: Riboflavin biosynthesis protein RibD [Planctomycetes bacterium ADurb.Bin401]|nr:MAG: Riboflavin biosynthesis protein RibD [Planctomycetes bacterium ADurb.Bin401]